MKIKFLNLFGVFVLGSLVGCKPGPVAPPLDIDLLSTPVEKSSLQLPEDHLYHRLGVTSLWETTTGLNTQGKGVIVAVIGSGVDYTNPDIRDSLWINIGEANEKARNSNWDDDGNGYADDVIGYDFYDGDARPYDWHGHDTYTASLIAASGNKNPEVVGVAPNARLMVLRTIGADGRGNGLDTYYALEYAVNNGAKIIYLNWPKGGFGIYTPAVKQAIELAGEHDVLVVVPAGNDSNQNVGAFMGGLNLVSMDNVIVVSGLGADGRLTSNTNYGQSLASIAAPAEESIGFFPRGEVSVSGLETSSVAAAYVAGAAALVSTLPGHSRAKDIREALLTQSSSESTVDVLSRGRLDLHSIAK